MTETRPLLVERQGHILILTLNRPEARNAIDAELANLLGNALEEADADADVRCIALAGAGAMFCAGADLKALARGERALADGAGEAWGFAGIANHPVSTPMIAAVQGFALGGGTEVAMACDLVVAADDARFGLPEVKRGLVAAGGGAIRMARQVPQKLAMEMLLTGEPIDADRAYELGLVNAVVAPEDLMRRTLALAETIAANAPLAVQASKRIALGILDGTIPDEKSAWQRSDSEMQMLRESDDFSEGTRAFAEKRPPQWQGR